VELRRFYTAILVIIILTTSLFSGAKAEASLASCVAKAFKKKPPAFLKVPDGFYSKIKTPHLYEDIKATQTQVGPLELKDKIEQEKAGTKITTYVGWESSPLNVSGNRSEAVLKNLPGGGQQLVLENIHLAGKKSNENYLPLTVHVNDATQANVEKEIRLSTFLILRQMKVLKIPEGGLSSFRSKEIQKVDAIFEWAELKSRWYRLHPGKSLKQVDANALAAQMTTLDFIRRPILESGHKIVGIRLDSTTTQKHELSFLKDFFCGQSLQQCEQFNKLMKKHDYMLDSEITINFSIEYELAPQ
jgi:hypothetical protein